MKKIISSLLAVSLAVSSALFPAGAQTSYDEILFASSDVRIEGSSYVKGNAIVTGGTVSGRDYKSIGGYTYVKEGVSVTNPSLDVKSYTGNETYSSFQLNSLPDSSVFSGSEFNDGSKNYTVGWSKSDFPNNSVISENSYIDTLTVNYSLNLNINATGSQPLIIRVKNLTLYGDLTVTGGGNTVIYVENSFSGQTGSINKAGTPEQVTIVYLPDKDVSISNRAKSNFSFIASDANVNVVNMQDFSGGVYTNKNFGMSSSGRLNGLVYAPDSDSSLMGSAAIYGKLITKSLHMTGDTRIGSGRIYNLPESVENLVIKKSSDSPSEPGGDEITIKAVVPRRMSVRLEDGTILKNGDTFKMKKGGEVRFQMCTNNWDTDTYTDDGNGIAGTKVYTFKQSAKTGKFLRVDTNKYFMAVRFHFKKGDYNKQTGIEKVLSKPLESLSVNLPLGSTITADAYIGYTKKASANVFVETAEDKSISYTDFYWNY